MTFRVTRWYHVLPCVSGVDFTKSRKSKINRKCYRKCYFQAFDWLKFTLTTDLRLTTFCEIDHWPTILVGLQPCHAWTSKEDNLLRIYETSNGHPTVISISLLFSPPKGVNHECDKFQHSPWKISPWTNRFSIILFFFKEHKYLSVKTKLTSKLPFTIICIITRNSIF